MGDTKEPVFCRWIQPEQQVRMLKRTFIKQCLYWQEEVPPELPKISGYKRPQPLCDGCPIALCVMGGLDFEKPANLEWIEMPARLQIPAARPRQLIVEEKKMEETVVASVPEGKKEIIVVDDAPEWRPEWDKLWRRIPPDQLAGIDLRRLREYWLRPLLAGKIRSKCPCCGRMQMHNGHGVCASCGKSGKSLTGPELLDMLLYNGQEQPLVERIKRLHVAEMAKAREEMADGEVVIQLAPASTLLPCGLAVLPGYESLAGILQEALDQAQSGKGKERHAQNDEPFDRQKICEITRRVGLGFALGQAIKKAEESLRLGGEAGAKEILGAINYLSAAVICGREGVR